MIVVFVFLHPLIIPFIAHQWVGLVRNIADSATFNKIY
jgi:hypothetical protein